MPRLFVAVWPPPAVLDRIDALARPPLDRVRWTTRDQWHVTLRFLGDVDETAAVTALETLSAPLATAGIESPVLELGGGAFALAVTGLDDLAAAVRAATDGLVDRPDEPEFLGHITVARMRRGATHRPDVEIARCRFPVEEIALVRSELDPDGARYTTRTRRAIG